MKAMKKILGLILTLAFVLTFAFNDTMTVEANYTYRVQIILGGTVPEDENGNKIAIGTSGYETNEELASFDADVAASMGAKVSADGQVLEIDGLKYDDKLSIPFASLVKIGTSEEDTARYYAKGLRIAGGDDILKGQSINVTVTGDESYVVAYGVGKTVSYKVRYVDKETGEAMTQVSEDTYYGAVGEVVYVPARHIDGYYPDAIYKTNSAGLLSHTEENPEGTVFTFYYSKYSGGTVYTSDTVTTVTSSVQGEGSYEYQYVNRGGDTNIEGVQGNAGGNAGGGNAGGGNAGGGNAGDADANAGDADQGGETTIADEETPQDIIDIDDEEVAKYGETKNTLVRNMIISIIIAIIAVLIILFALLVAQKKRKAAIIARLNKKDEDE